MAISRSYILSAGLLALVACLISPSVDAQTPPPAAPPPQQDQGDDGKKEKEAKPEKEPIMTRGELQRQLVLKRGQLEDLLAKFDRREDPPTSEQLAEFKKLRQEVADLEARIAAMAPVAPAPEDNSWRARWVRFEKALEDVTRYDLKDGMFRFRLGVNAQLDGTLTGGNQRLTDTVGTLDDGLDVRRLRIFAAGRLVRRWDFHFQYDFGADSGVKDAWVEGVKFVKFARWRLGNFKEPFSFERHASAYDLSFLEWSTPVATFAPGRGVGVMLRHDQLEQRMQWAVAAITSSQSGADNAGTSNITFTTRVTGTPVFKQDGQELVHVGFSFSARSPRSGSVRYRTRPEARFVTPFLDTGNMSVDSNNLTGFEFATVQGPWWAQAELIRSDLHGNDLGDPTFSGSYIEGGWFLTGETRPYQTWDGTFGRVLPFRPYSRAGNPFKKDSNGGAIEVAVRLSTTDLTDAEVRAGKIDDLSLAMNWYLTPATRFMANYIHSRVNNGDGGKANIFLIRYQFNP